MSETKRTDVVNSSYGAPYYIPTAGNVFYLSGVGQGSADWQRIGNRIQPNYFKIKVTLFPQAGYNSVRLILFTYNCVALSGTVAQPIMTDLLEDSNTTGGTNYQSGYKLEGDNGFRILYDRVVHLNFAGTDKAFLEERTITISKNKLPKEMQYLGTGITIVSAGKGALFMGQIPMRDGSNASGTGVQGFHTAQLSYKDL